MSDPSPLSPVAKYEWKIGDVFTDGRYRWQVEAISGDKAVLRSCGTSWASTCPLTFDEWREGGRWKLESELANVG